MHDNDLGNELEDILDELDAMDIRQNRVRRLKKKNIWKSIPYVGIFVVCALVFAYCSDYIIEYLVDAKKQEALYSGLSDMVSSNRPSLPEPTVPQPPQNEVTVPDGTDFETPSGTDTNTPTESTNPDEKTEVTEPVIPPEVTEPVILPEFQAIYELNNDFIGWIYVPGAKIDYPVMQTYEDPNFYLDHDFEKNWNPAGCIYARRQCDVFRPSDNIVLYGHHMRNGSMFASLKHYTEKEFWEENQFVYFDTLYERHVYQIIAVFKTTANIGLGFNYHQFNDAANQEEFDAFMAEVHRLQFYDTGLTAQYGDKLITMSTCEYTLDNGRLAVLAKRIS